MAEIERPHEIKWMFLLELGVFGGIAGWAAGAKDYAYFGAMATLALAVLLLASIMLTVRAKRES